MKLKRFTAEQIIGVLKEAEAGAKTKDVCRKYGISDVTFCCYAQAKMSIRARRSQKVSLSEDLPSRTLNRN